MVLEVSGKSAEQESSPLAGGVAVDEKSAGARSPEGPALPPSFETPAVVLGSGSTEGPASPSPESQAGKQSSGSDIEAPATPGRGWVLSNEEAGESAFPRLIPLTHDILIITDGITRVGPIALADVWAYEDASLEMIGEMMRQHLLCANHYKLIVLTLGGVDFWLEKRG